MTLSKILFIMKNNKKIIIFSGPSGSGKTTIARNLEKNNSSLDFSISATTRKKRSGETDKKDYYFINPEDFREKIRNDEFIEWEEVYKGTYYGTLKSEIERIWTQRKNALFDVDVEGALTIKKLYGEKVLAVIVKPPSLDILKQRLAGRGTENEETFKKRFGKAKKELSYARQFDEILVNDVLEESFEKAQRLVDAFLDKN